MKTKDFYFHISNTGVRDFVTAYSFVDAKARALASSTQTITNASFGKTPKIPFPTSHAPGSFSDHCPPDRSFHPLHSSRWILIRTLPKNCCAN
jgi:hypothetical protein